MHILHTVLYRFPRLLTRRICLTIKSFFSWWSFLRTLLFIILKGSESLLAIILILLQIASNSSYGNNLRIKALHFVSWLARIKPKVSFDKCLGFPRASFAQPPDRTAVTMVDKFLQSTHTHKLHQWKGKEGILGFGKNTNNKTLRGKLLPKCFRTQRLSWLRACLHAKQTAVRSLIGSSSTICNQILLKHQH